MPPKAQAPPTYTAPPRPTCAKTCTRTCGFELDCGPSAACSCTGDSSKFLEDVCSTCSTAAAQYTCKATDAVDESYCCQLA